MLINYWNNFYLLFPSQSFPDTHFRNKQLMEQDAAPVSYMIPSQLVQYQHVIMPFRIQRWLLQYQFSVDNRAMN